MPGEGPDERLLARGPHHAVEGVRHGVHGVHCKKSMKMTRGPRLRDLEFRIDLTNQVLLIFWEYSHKAFAMGVAIVTTYEAKPKEVREIVDRRRRV